MSGRSFVRRAVLVAATLALAAALLVPHATDARADCDETVTECDLNQDNYVIPMEVNQLTAVVPVHDDAQALALYEHLIPDEYSMPDEPLLALWLVEVFVPQDNAEADARWIEGSISLKTEHDDEVGWFHLSEPTNDTGAYDTGRDVGFPKYLADATLEQRDDGGWTGHVEIDGRTTIHYEWTKKKGQGTQELMRWTKAEDPYFSVKPFWEGDDKFRVKFTPKPYVPVNDVSAKDPNLGTIGGNVPSEDPWTAINEPEHGRMQIRLDPDLDAVHARSAEAFEHSTPLADIFPDGTDLSDLVDVEQTVPGHYMHSKHNLLLQTKQLPPDREGSRCAPPNHRGGDWPTYGQGLHNHRSQPAEKTIDPGNVAELDLSWKFATPMAGRVPPRYGTQGQHADSVAGTPIVANGCVYTGAQNGRVFAVNADTGELVWQRNLHARIPMIAYGVDGTGTGRVFVNVADIDEEPNPHVVALDPRTGETLWKTGALETLPGAEMTGGPVAYSLGGRDFVLTGISGWPGDEQSSDEWYQPGAFRGSVVWLDQRTGEVVHQEYVIPHEDFCRHEEPSPDCENDLDRPYDGYSGAGVWTTQAVDLETGHVYAGTGNPPTDASAKHHSRANALLKLDGDPRRDTFGQILGHYEGGRDQQPFPNDLDVGASPNLVELDGGRKVVGALQKSGVYHMADARTMDGVWKRTLGQGGTFAGHASTSAFDGENLFVPTGPVPEQLFWLGPGEGALNGTQPIPFQGVYGPSTHANGVVYLGDNGFLRGFDAASTAPVMVRSMWTDAQGMANTTEGGVAVARNTVYAAAGHYVLAYRLPDDPRSGSGGQPSGGGDDEGSDEGTGTGGSGAGGDGSAGTSGTLPATGGGAGLAALGALVLLGVARRRTRRS